jgi:hypothetical protein
MFRGRSEEALDSGCVARGEAAAEAGLGCDMVVQGRWLVGLAEAGGGGDEATPIGPVVAGPSVPGPPPNATILACSIGWSHRSARIAATTPTRRTVNALGRPAVATGSAAADIKTWAVGGLQWRVTAMP